MNLLQQNQELLQMQQARRVSSGRLLQNIFSISSRYPFSSLIFALAFGVFTNATFETISYFLAQSSYSLLRLLSTDGILITLMVGAFCRVWWKYRSYVKLTPLTQKKVLITLASIRADFEQSPSYGVYKALTYQPNSTTGVLEEVVIVATEEPASRKMASDLANSIQSDGRKAIVKNIAVATNDVRAINKQIASIVRNYLAGGRKPHELVSDYTGGTKMMSVALYEASEEEFIAQVYFTDAMTKNHSRYTAGR